MKKLILSLMAVFIIIPSLVFGATVTLQWNSVEEAAGYKIYWKTDTSGPPYNGTATDNQGNPLTSPYDVGSATSGDIIIPPGNYYFAATAYNEYGESGYSEELGPITIEDAPVPLTLELDTSTIDWEDAERFTGPTYYGTTDKDITINWDEPANGADSYDVCIWDVYKKMCIYETNVIFPSVTFQLPQTGCYKIGIKAKLGDEETGWVRTPFRIIGWPGGIGDGGGIVIN